MTVLHAVEEGVGRDELERIVAVWQQRLRLGHWQIRIDWDTPSDHHADIKPWSVYDYATLRFNSAAPTWSPLIANRNIVHELLHLALRDVDYAVETAELVMAANTYKLFEAAVDNASEAAIDRLATVLVHLAGPA